MSINANDLLELAEDILTAKGSEEVNFRNSAGRSYYAIFHFCEPFFKSLPEAESDKKLGSHERHASKLKRSPDADIRELGNLMDQGRVRRTIADYKIWRPFHKTQSEELLGFAKTVKATIDRIKTSPSP